KGALWRSAQEGWPVNILFARIFVYLVIPFAAFLVRVSAVSGGRPYNLSNQSVLDRFFRLVEMIERRVLAADLQDALVRFDNLGNLPRFVNGVGERLFQVNVLACPQRGHCVAVVPMIGRSDDDGVNVLARAEFAEIV